MKNCCSLIFKQSKAFAYFIAEAISVTVVCTPPTWWWSTYHLLLYLLAECGSLIPMDDGGEGTSWLGNIVQKFEDLFSEVDVAVRQVSGYSSLLTFFVWDYFLLCVLAMYCFLSIERIPKWFIFSVKRKSMSKTSLIFYESLKFMSYCARAWILTSSLMK